MGKPTDGQLLDIDDVKMIVEAIEARRANFPEEPEDITMLLVLLNIGDRFTRVRCVNGHWSGGKEDVIMPEDGGFPQCPDGHRVRLDGHPLKLAWKEDKPENR